MKLEHVCSNFDERQMRAKTRISPTLSTAEIRDYSSISTLVTYGMSIDDLLSTLLTMRVSLYKV